MMKNLIFLLTVVSFVACSETVELMPPGHSRNTYFEFSVYNSQNVDLLDPTTPNHFKEDDIKLFYEVDGEMIEVYYPNLEYPRNFLIFKYEHENESEYRIRVFLNDSETSEKTITQIQWNEADTDTVEATYRRTDRSVHVSKVWINGLEIWDITIGDNQYYRLIK